MAIGIDLDELLCDTITCVVPYFNSEFGMHRSRDDFRTYQISDVYSKDKDTCIQMFYDWMEDTRASEMTPVPGAVEGVRSLNRIDDLIVITARYDRYRDVTEEWLDRYFPGMFSEVCMNREAVLKWGGYHKSEVVQDKGVTLLLEDQPVHALDVAQVGVPVLLYDTPWNQDGGVRQHPLITRTYGWDEMVVRILTDNLS